MKNLSGIKGSMTQIIESNIQQINSAKTVSEMVATLKSLFNEAGLDTPASNRLIQNVSKKRNIGDAQLVVYNSMLCGSGLAVI